MKLAAVVKHDPRFKRHIDKEVRELPGALVIILPETLKNTKIGIRVDVVPEDLRFEKPQPTMLRHLKMGERTKKAIDRIIAIKFQ